MPTLIAETGRLVLTQSIAILEYLEEKYPEKPLLPKGIAQRSIVRSLVNIIANDIQPVTNMRVLKHVEEVGGSRADWAREYLQLGLNGIISLYDKLISLRSYCEADRWKILCWR